MKYMVIGANGMLGHAFVNELAMEDIIPADLPEFDITDYIKLQRQIEEISPDAIINVAAYTDVDGSEENKNLAHRVNAVGVENLAKICKKNNIILVHFSTDYVFDGKNQTGYKEEDQPNPINSYGQSKLDGEKAVMDLEKYYLVRTAWMFGPNGNNFVNTMLELARSQPEVKVVNDQIGNPTYSKDLAQAVRTLIKKEFPYGIYHITNNGKCSWHDLAKEIFKLKDINIKVKEISSKELKCKASRPTYSVLQNNKFNQLRSWQEALKDYLTLTK